MRLKIALTFYLAGLLVLFAMAIVADSMRYENLLLVSAKIQGQSGLDIWELEKLCDELPLSYEIRQRKGVRALNNSMAATIIGTNSYYPSILGHPVVSGSFFTCGAWGDGLRYASLGERAARELFGSLDVQGQTVEIDGSIYLVTGALADSDESSINVYIPSSLMDGSPSSLMVMLRGDTGEAQAKGMLVGAGVYSDGYDFYNLGELAGMFTQRLAVALSALGAQLGLALAAFASGCAAAALRNIKVKLNDYYMAELISNSRAALIRLAFGVAGCVSGAAAALCLVIYILDTCLGWRELLHAELTPDVFALRLEWLASSQGAGWVVFAMCLCMIAAVAVILAAQAFKFRDGGVRIWQN